MYAGTIKVREKAVKHKVMKNGDGLHTVLTKFRCWPFAWFVRYKRIPNLSTAKQLIKDIERESVKSVQVYAYSKATGGIESD